MKSPSVDAFMASLKPSPVDAFMASLEPTDDVVDLDALAEVLARNDPDLAWMDSYEKVSRGFKCCTCGGFEHKRELMQAHVMRACQPRGVTRELPEDPPF